MNTTVVIELKREYVVYNTTSTVIKYDSLPIGVQRKPSILLNFLLFIRGAPLIIKVRIFLNTQY